LIQEGGRDVVWGGGDDDGIERSVLWPAIVPVCLQTMDVGVSQRLQPHPGALCQFWNYLDGIDFDAGNLGQDGRLVAGTGADLQDPIPLLEFQEFRHQGDDVGLGNGLAIPNRKWIIPVCLVLFI